MLTIQIMYCMNYEEYHSIIAMFYIDYCQSNIDKFIRTLEEKIYNPVTFNIDSDEFEKFTTIVKETMEDSFKVDPSTLSSRRNRLVNPWITSGIIESIQTKTFLYHQWKKTVTETDIVGDNTLYMNYKDFRKTLKNTIIQAKRLNSYKKFQSAEGDCKRTWQLINELRGKKKNEVKPYFLINGEIIENRRKIADEFNKYFLSIAATLNSSTATLDSNLTILPLPQFSDYLNKSVSGMRNCTTPEIKKIISELSSSKASDIPIRVLKACSDIISPLLTKFYNMFMQKAIFPIILKVAQVTPIYKKGDSQLLENYRPVSMLPIFGKLFEKIIYSRLYSFLMTKNIICGQQFGFRKHHSTSHAINYSVNLILDGIQSQKHILGIFIDLSKAFDTINHGILLEKLCRYGIRGNCLELLKEITESEAYEIANKTLEDLQRYILSNQLHINLSKCTYICILGLI